jgi:hypothetical protein
MDETDGGMLWKTVNRMGMLDQSVRKMKALTAKMKTVTLMDKGT